MGNGTAPGIGNGDWAALPSGLCPLYRGDTSPTPLAAETARHREKIMMLDVQRIDALLGRGGAGRNTPVTRGKH